MANGGTDTYVLDAAQAHALAADAPVILPKQVGTYTHTQGSPASTWTITHNLGRRPSVTVEDSTGEVGLCKVVYTSDNVVTLTFAGTMSGRADLT